MSNSELERLIAAWLDGRIGEADSEALQQQLRESPEARAAFRSYTQLDAVIREVADSESVGLLSRIGDAEAVVAAKKRSTTRVAWAFAAAAAVVAVIATAQFSRPSGEPMVATVTGVSGSLQWTGDGGRIFHDLTAGTELHGGTIEGMSPESWFELKFRDGSTITISGSSTLTFSDHGQKTLHLREGNLSGNVMPQPVDKPMLVYTRSAMLTVLGTSFDVETETASTLLNVRKGEVRLKRLSDGRSVDVPANHRVIATADRDLIREKVPDCVDRWKSQLHLGPDHTNGKWLPARDDRDASLKAIPFVPQNNPSRTLHLAGIRVSQTTDSPVILRTDSRFVIRGRVARATGFRFGFRVVRPTGEFAGKFLSRPALEFDSGGQFEAVFHLDQFRLDPSDRHRRDKLPKTPDDLVLTGIWCFTNSDGPTGLALTEVELIPPE